MDFSSKLALGTVQFGLDYGVSNKHGKTSTNEVQNIIDFAQYQGIVTLDTARAYGESEKVLGEIKQIGQLTIVSKFMPSSSDGAIEQQFEASCNQMRVSSLYGYLSHRPLSLIQNPKDWSDLKMLKNEGKIQKIGYSLNTPEELTQLLSAKMIPDLVQVPFNYLDRRFENQLIELKKQGCEVHARSSFLQGLFFIPALDLEDYFDEIKPTLAEIQSKQGNQLAGALLRFTLSRDFIDKVVVGVENTEQLRQNITQVANASELEEQSFHFSENVLVPSNWPVKKIK